VPEAVGLYNPANEHDACGVAMVATLNKTKNHEIVSKALTALRNLEHRGASGAEPDSGDGAGILIQIPDEFFRSVVDFKLPKLGFYATGVFFIEAGNTDYLAQIIKIASEEGLRILGWRDLPINSKSIGKTALSVMPSFKQIFVEGLKAESDLVLERMVFCLRKRVEHTIHVLNGKCHCASAELIAHVTATAPHVNADSRIHHIGKLGRAVQHIFGVI